VRKAEGQGRAGLIFCDLPESDPPVEVRVAVGDSNLDTLEAQRLKSVGEQSLPNALPLTLGRHCHRG
jgi:hypothetical protein